MRLQDELRGARRLFSGLTFYEKFEHAVVLVVTLLIVLIVASATWHLALAVFGLIVADQIDPANQEVFQAVFGMIFTVIIA
jgi:flagellar biosynthesis protein FlhB